MARGNPIDAGEMFKAGSARNNEGPNRKTEAHNKFMEGATNLVFSTIGGMAVDAVKSRKRNMNEFTNQGNSQMVATIRQLKTIPNGNESLEGDIKWIKEQYDKDTKIANSLVKSKKVKSESKQRMEIWMQQLHGINTALQTYKVNAKSSQDLVGSIDSEDRGDGNENMSLAANDMESNNTAAQANGLMGRNLRWGRDIDITDMSILRGGEWTDDGDGGSVYTLKPGYTNKDKKSEFGSAKYKDLKFAGKSDNTMGTELKGFSADIAKSGYTKGGKGWNAMEKLHKDNFMTKVNGYSPDQFKDYYFGGLEGDYSTRRMAETAPAYKKIRSSDLMIQLGSTDRTNDKFEDDGSGNMVYKKGEGPGSKDWLASLTILKKQDFDKGSAIRKTAGENAWNDLQGKYEEMKTMYRADNPEQADDDDQTDTFELFGAQVPKPTNSKMKSELANAQHIASGRSIVTIGGEQFKYDKKSDSYKQQYAIVGEKRVKLPPGEPSISKAELIQMSSTIYGNIPLDYFKGEGGSLGDYQKGGGTTMQANFGKNEVNTDYFKE